MLVWVSVNVSECLLFREWIVFVTSSPHCFLQVYFFCKCFREKNSALKWYVFVCFVCILEVPWTRNFLCDWLWLCVSENLRLCCRTNNKKCYCSGENTYFAVGCGLLLYICCLWTLFKLKSNKNSSSKSDLSAHEIADIFRAANCPFCLECVCDKELLKWLESSN